MNAKNKKLLYTVIALILIIAGTIIQRGEATEETNIGTEVSTGQAVVEHEPTAESTETLQEDYVEYYFRNEDLLEQHYKKHGMEMGFESMEAYEEAAGAVVTHPDVLSKTEAEDGDYVYYIEETNEFVVISKEGYIRTYFNPSAGIDYYNRQ